MKKLILLICFFVSIKSFSQFNHAVANATVVAGTYTDLGTTGTAITTNFSGLPMTFDDDSSSIQNIGFNFSYNGSTFTQFVLNSNGFIKLGNTSGVAVDMYDVLATTSTSSNIIAPFNYDLDGGVNPEYRVFTTAGAPGSRVCTIQFKNVKDYSATVGQYTNINFQIRLYEGTNNIEFVYGSFTASAAAAAFIGTSAGIIGNNLSSVISVTKASASLWSAATFLNRAYIAGTDNKFNNRNNILPVSGTTYRFTALLANDIAVKQVYSYGKTGRGIATPIKAYVTNLSTLAKTNVVVTVNVAGANTYTSSVTIASLPIGAAGTVTFNGFVASNIGANTITVSVPSDDANANNTATSSQEVTTNELNYSVGTTATAPVNIGAGAKVAVKFGVPYTNLISNISIDISNAGNLFDVALFNNVAGVPGTSLWSSTGLTSVVGTNNISVPNVSVTDSFYVVVTQTGAALGTSYQTENPLRTGTFYLLSSGATTWFDLSGNASNIFRMMVGVTTANALPIQLTSFNGQLKNSNAILNWSTSAEINADRFEVERSNNNSNWTNIATVAAKGAASNSYQITDAGLTAGKWLYRLKMIDKDGKFTYSQIVNLDLNGKQLFVLNQNYPNPVKGSTQLSYQVSVDAKVVIDLFTNDGKKVATLVNQQQAVGSYNITLDLTKYGLSSGNYMYKMVAFDKNNSEVFSATKTMVIAK